jgi:hypothetical protein
MKIQWNTARLQAAKTGFLLHATASVAVALLAAALIFGAWFASPFAHMLGGFELFGIIMGVDVVCGPLLTAVLYNPQKSRRELCLDIGLVICLQLGALGYGLHTLWLARPVVVVFEVDRYRVLSLADLSAADATPLRHRFTSPAALGAQPIQGGQVDLSAWGPRMVSAHVSQPEDADYLQELDKSLSGQEPSTRPARWRAYLAQPNELTQWWQRAQPLDRLQKQYPASTGQIDAEAKSCRASADDAQPLRWMPVQASKTTGYVALVQANGTICGWLPLDGFF